MKVILFIGHHKVGSTSLQDFLARNSVTLAQEGILYPSVTFDGMALMLAGATGRSAPFEFDIIPINIREAHNALGFRMLASCNKGKVPAYHEELPGQEQMFRAIRKQIEYLQPHTVILAAEVFANFAPADPALIQRLRDIFPPEAEFTVLATFRRIDEYIASWHMQRLRFGHELAPLRNGGMKDYYGNIHFNYQMMLNGWLKRMPDAKFVLRNYSDVRASGGSVVDFIAQSGVEFPENLAPGLRSNDSLHRGLFEVARRGAHELPKPLFFQLLAYLEILGPELALPKSSEIELFGAQIRQEMATRFEPFHRFLSEAAGKTSFFPDLEKVQQTLPITDMEVLPNALAELRKHIDSIEEPEIQAFLRNLDA